MYYLMGLGPNPKKSSIIAETDSDTWRYVVQWLSVNKIPKRRLLENNHKTSFFEVHLLNFFTTKVKKNVSQILIPIPTVQNKIFISADFEQKKFDRKSAKNHKKPNSFCSKHCMYLVNPDTEFILPILELEQFKGKLAIKVLPVTFCYSRSV